MYTINKAPYEFEDAYMDISNFFTNGYLTVCTNYIYDEEGGMFHAVEYSEVPNFESLSIGKYYAIDTGGYFSPQPFKAMIEFDIKEIDTENKILLLNSSEFSMIVEEGGGNESPCEYEVRQDGPAYTLLEAEVETPADAYSMLSSMFNEEGVVCLDFSLDSENNQLVPINQLHSMSEIPNGVSTLYILSDTVLRPCEDNRDIISKIDLIEVDHLTQTIDINSSITPYSVFVVGGQPNVLEYNFVYDPDRSGYLCTGPTEDWNGQVVDLKMFDSGVGQEYYDDGVNGIAPIVGVGDNAFENTSVGEVYFTQHTEYIGNYAFANTNILDISFNAYHGDLQIAPYSFNNSSITHINFHTHNVNVIIGGSAFTDNPIQNIYMGVGTQISVNPSIFNSYGISVSISKEDEDFYLNDSGWSFFVNNFNLTFNVRGGGSGAEFRKLGSLYSTIGSSFDKFRGFKFKREDEIQQLLNNPNQAENGYIYVSNEIEKDTPVVENFWVQISRDNITYRYSDIPFLLDNYFITGGGELNGDSNTVTAENFVVGKTYYRIDGDITLTKFEIVTNDNMLEEFNTNTERWVNLTRHNK